MRLRQATVADVPLIRAIAGTTWPIAYGDILSPAQLRYMLERMYSAAALREQMLVKGHRFILAVRQEETLGFAAFEPHHGGRAVTRLHKLYVLPAAQGSGAGRLLLNGVLERALADGDRAVELNVNRFNTARRFYEHCGFRVVRDEVIDIGQGYVMDDHVMRLDLA
ncbi:MAG: GNAT family N-acetyltransferase [Flavobacteriales bacterium]